MLTGIGAILAKPVDPKDKTGIYDDRSGQVFDYSKVASQYTDVNSVPSMKLDPDNQTPAEDRFWGKGFWPFGGFASFSYTPFIPFFGGGFGGGFGPGFGGPGFGGPGFGGPPPPPVGGGYGGGGF